MEFVAHSSQPGRPREMYFRIIPIGPSGFESPRDCLSQPIPLQYDDITVKLPTGFFTWSEGAFTKMGRIPTPVISNLSKKFTETFMESLGPHYVRFSKQSATLSQDGLRILALDEAERTLYSWEYTPVPVESSSRLMRPLKWKQLPEKIEGFAFSQNGAFVQIVPAASDKFQAVLRYEGGTYQLPDLLDTNEIERVPCLPKYCCFRILISPLDLESEATSDLYIFDTETSTFNKLAGVPPEMELIVLSPGRAIAHSGQSIRVPGLDKSFRTIEGHSPVVDREGDRVWYHKIAQSSRNLKLFSISLNDPMSQEIDHGQCGTDIRFF
jgi:hypothetical protein